MLLIPVIHRKNPGNVFREDNQQPAGGGVLLIPVIYRKILENYFARRKNSRPGGRPTYTSTIPEKSWKFISRGESPAGRGGRATYTSNIPENPGNLFREDKQQPAGVCVLLIPILCWKNPGILFARRNNSRRVPVHECTWYRNVTNSKWNPSWNQGGNHSCDFRPEKIYGASSRVRDQNGLLGDSIVFFLFCG